MATEPAGPAGHTASPHLDPLVDPRLSPGQVTDIISGLALGGAGGGGWLIALGLGFLLVSVLGAAVSWLFLTGIGVFGTNIPVAWAFPIVNFVWWIGIGHAGTFISAFLVLMRQNWRASINRMAEAMTLFAVACAGLFPILHLGRPGLFYWLLPYPDTMGLWPQFRSPLIWDIFAVLTYATVSLVFWYVGLLPDLARLRDAAQSRFARRAYGLFALGWRGAASHWHRYRMAYLLLAGLATPLVISVHSIVGMDFAASITPGWHSGLLPPYFVAGALFSGFAMVLTLALPLRRVYGLQGLITDRHIDNLAKMMLLTGLIVDFSYVVETFMAWYSGDIFERAMLVKRFTGPYAVASWTMITCNVVVPQFLWSPRLRRSPMLLFVIALLVNLGMWMERYVIIITSLAREYVPAQWGDFHATVWDVATLLGSLGLFFTLFLLFIRFLPVISMTEVRELVHQRRGDLPPPADDGGSP